MTIPEPFIILETEHWILNHHMASALPGYLMLGSRAAVDSLADLPDCALTELGVLQARVQRVMQQYLQPRYLYIGRYGHEPGFPIHFHCIPVYDWVEQLFWQDERYRALQRFTYSENLKASTDGAELTLFIWREFGENPIKPTVQGPGIEQAIQGLREMFQS